MSVLTAMNSTPSTPASIMRLTALTPAPPTPTTRSTGSACPWATFIAGGSGCDAAGGGALGADGDARAWSRMFSGMSALKTLRRRSSGVGMPS